MTEAQPPQPSRPSPPPEEPQAQAEPQAEAERQAVPQAAEWQLLDPRMLAVNPLRSLAAFVPLIFLFVIVGGPDLNTRVFPLVIAVIALVIAGMLRWLTTRYRITDERVELRAGLLFRSSRSIPRDRIRSVDLTAGPVHRIFGLTVAKVGTGEGAEGLESRELTLDAVSSREADHLRELLLNRLGDGAPDGATSDAAGDPGTAPSGTELARLSWSWLRFAPLTASSLAAVGAVVGAFTQFIGELGIDPTRVTEFGDEQFATAPLWLGVTVLMSGLLVIAVLGALLIFVEGWWGFRLTRERGGTLRIRRGLLTTRSVSLEERRLRGVEFAEPLLLRLGSGARLTAVATGLGGGAGGGRGDLLPPAPLAEAHRVAGLVLVEDPSPTRAALRRHPLAALRRRLFRAVLPVLLLFAGLRWAPVPEWMQWAALGVLPVALLLAVDAYRNLGHTLVDRYLVTRHGTGVRRTVALKRSGVIGWRVSQSLFQRQAGLVTLTATTAAGSGGYHVIDVNTADGLAVADAAVPGLLRPFLQHEQGDQAVVPSTVSGRAGAGPGQGLGSPT